MPRTVWQGTLSFGLVTIPVGLYPATEPKDVRFHLVDELGRRVRYRRFVPAEDPEDQEPSAPEATPPADVRESPAARELEAPQPEPPPDAETEVTFEELRRGFETEDGRLVVMSREEIAEVRPEPSRTIDIEAFVALPDIDPVYFEKSYHVAPRPGGEKPYVLLLEAMERAGRVGIGRFVLRTKPHLVAIRPGDGVLGLETLFFADEVRSGRELVRGLEGQKVSERELDMADLLIEALKKEWSPDDYSDTYREELLRRIREKAPIDAAPDRLEAPQRPGVEGLMEALKASVEAAKAGNGKRSRKRPA